MSEASAASDVSVLCSWRADLGATIVSIAIYIHMSYIF